MTAEPSILLTCDDKGVAVLTLNRPAKMNSFDGPMIDLWAEKLAAAGADPAVKVIVVTGAGRAFCAGGDIDDLLTYRDRSSMEFKNYLSQQIHGIARILERLDKPVIAAMNGTARGAGLDMALMCDMRIAAESAVFAESYINVGMIAGDGGTWYLTRLIGTARALELFWTGRAVTAAEAERIGIINRMVPDAELMTAVMETAHRIAAQPQHAIRYFKRAVYQGVDMALATHLDMVSSHMAILKDTADHQASLNAFKTRKG